MPNNDRETGPEPPVHVPETIRQAVTEETIADQALEWTSFFSDSDIYLFNEGTHQRIYEKFGAHPGRAHGEDGTYFAVWAPAARQVSVIGEFNGWDKGANLLRLRGSSGVWEGFVPRVGHGSIYKYHVISGLGHHAVDKTDPIGFLQEIAPKTASVIWNLDYEWNDSAWMSQRRERQSLASPISIYEMHIGSWRRHPNGDSMSYRELAPQLIDYLKTTGFTHVEFLPVMEHPFFGSWGYQVTGFFASSSRYGTPQDLMYLIDQLHQNGIGVILDWVPSHFPTDEHGLAFFDGTHLYEHADPRQGFHPDWSSFIFNYGRNEVRSFLISSAIFWLDRFHADGLRVDAVASMLYLDYSRKSDEWIPNKYGGRDNLEAIEFLQRLNTDVYESFPDVQMIAEESTAWPMVSRPIYLGGLGFGLKWDMGWMHDTLKYLSHDPIHRKFHHTQLTFRMMYAFTENFLLPLSHDEVVHGKGSLIRKMPGDDDQKFASLRLLFAYLFAQPGKKLLFMGGEFAQDREWNHDKQLDWELLANERNLGVALLIRDLNQIYRSNPAMHRFDERQEGFEWIDATDIEQSVVTFMRKGRPDEPPVVAVFNFTPIPRSSYRIGVPHFTFWREIINTDAQPYGGSGTGNMGGVPASPIGYHNQLYSLTLTLPPLSAIFLTPVEEA